eukprot:9065727-Karenia_brevis.AAC.2
MMSIIAEWICQCIPYLCSPSLDWCCSRLCNRISVNQQCKRETAAPAPWLDQPAGVGVQNPQLMLRDSIYLRPKRHRCLDAGGVKQSSP